MPTSIDVFAKVRGHEREALLRAAREAGMLPYFRTVESPAMPVVESWITLLRDDLARA